MHSKSHNIEIMINDEADAVIEELSQSLLSRYEISRSFWVININDFKFDCVNL